MHLAVYTLLIAVALVVLWFALARRRTPYTRRQFTLYIVNNFFARVMWRTQTSGPLPVKENEGAVIVSNHRAGVDPLLIQLSANRVVHWLVAREYYEMPVISFIFRNLKSIPVNRGGIDTAATKMAIRLVQEGEIVGLFPEGRVNMTDDLLLPGRPGAALIALKGRAVVIPCYVTGAPYNGTALGSFFMFGHARVVVGQRIDLSEYFGREGDKAVLEELTKRFLVEIAKLAGEENYPAKVAGRKWKPGDEEAGEGDVTPHDIGEVTNATDGE